MLINIDAVPDLGRRASLQVLVRPHVVVPEPEWQQRRVELMAIGHAPAIEFGLERAEEAFDAAVLPGAVPFGGLMADAEPGQREDERCSLGPATLDELLAARAAEDEEASAESRMEPSCKRISSWPQPRP